MVKGMDFGTLAPHRPLKIGDARYVSRPEASAEKLAAFVAAGSQPIAVSGTVGCGKSTELAAAGARLQYSHPVFLVPVSWRGAAGRAADALLDAILRRVLEVAASNLGFAPSPDLSSLVDRLHGSGSASFLPTALQEPPDVDFVLRMALREIAQAQRNEALPVILVDGLERWPAEASRAGIRALLTFSDDAKLAFIVPPSLVTGPDSYDLIQNVRLFQVRPVAVTEPSPRGKRGRIFLKDLVRTHIGGSWPDSVESIVDRAVSQSGGVPRAFLQLLKDASMYARLAGRHWPSDEDLEEAIRDQTRSLRSLLREGDVDRLVQAEGTNGLEVPLEHRIRYLVHGLLLEYQSEREQPILRAAPLLGLDDLRPGGPASTEYRP